MRNQLIPLIASAVAVLLQIVVAPILTLFSIVPNFIVAFAMVLAILRPSDSTYLYMFVLGLVADLLAQTPVGLSSLLLLLAAFVLRHAFEVLDASTPVMPLISLGAGLLAFELLFAIVLLITGYNGSVVDLLLFRALPSALFAALIGALFYLVMRRFPMAQPVNDAWRVTENIRFR